MGVLAASHRLVAIRGDDYSGALIVLDHVFSLTLVLGLFAIAAGVGGRVLNAAGFDLHDPLETLLFRTALGLGTVASAIVIIGLVSVGPVALGSIFLAATLLARNELRELSVLVRGAFSSLRAHAGDVSLSIFGLVMLFVIIGALMPPTDWDALMYHLRVPDQFLRGGAIRVPDDNAYAAFIGLPHMLYLPLLALGSPSGPAIFSAVCTLGLSLTAFALALRFLDARTARFGLVVLWGSTILVVVGVTPRTDTVLAFYLLLVHHAVLRARESDDPRFLYLGAALGGMAFGVKYNAIIYLLALAPLAWWILRSARQHRRVAILAVTLSVALAAASPWLLKNALLLGDPAYPYLTERRLEPWLVQTYSGATPARLPKVDAATIASVWSAQAPFNLQDFFLAPHRIAVEAEGESYHANILLLLLPLSLLFWRRTNLAGIGAPALGYVGLVVLLNPSATSLRYLVPALAPLTLVAFYSLAATLEKLVTPRFARALLWGISLFVLADTASFAVREMSSGRRLEHLAGSVSRQEFLEHRTGGYANVVSFANEWLPGSSRLLMLFEARGYYFRTPVLQDNGIVNWPFLVPRAAQHDCLRSTGITHVLLNEGAVRYYARRGVDLAPFELDAFERFAQECLSPIYSSGGMTLFRLGGGAVHEISPGASSLQ